MAARIVTALSVVCLAGAALAQQVEAGTRFAGWRGETAILLTESVAAGQLSSSYSSLRVGRRSMKLPRGDRPTGLPRGNVLVADYAPMAGEPPILFRFEADPKEMGAMDRAIAAASENPAEERNRFPEVHATLRMIFRGEDIWTTKRTYGVSMGEAGYDYRPPRLRFAALSPRKSVLFVELTGSGGSEFFLIPAQPQRSRRQPH